MTPGSPVGRPPGDEPDGGLEQLRHAVDQAVDEAVVLAVDEAVVLAVDEAVEGAIDRADTSAERAEQAETGALNARVAAETARDDAVWAGRAAVEAAIAVAPEDNPLETAIRKLEAHADEDNPFGVPGRPLSSRSPFWIAFTAALGIGLAYGLVSGPPRGAPRRSGRRGPARGAAVLRRLRLRRRAPDRGAGAGLRERAAALRQPVQGNERILSFDERFGLLDRAETLVAITGLVPLIGATIGAIVVTTVAMFTSLQAGIICVVFYLVYQQVENYVLYPKIMQRSVNVSPAATVVAVLVGGSLLGALLAIPMAAGVQLVLDEVVAPRQDAA